MPKPWKFLTNHALVLLHVYLNPNSTLRAVADAVGITERHVYSILQQLKKDACVSVSKQGRRNTYTVNLRAVFTRPTGSPYALKQMVNGLWHLLREFPDEEQSGGGGGGEPGGDEPSTGDGGE